MAAQTNQTNPSNGHRPLHVEFLRVAARNRSRPLLADSLGTNLTAGKALLGSLALRRALARRLHKDAPMVGLLLPPSVPAALANIACLLLGKVPVNLNYISATVLNSCIAQCHIRQVISSRRFWDRINLEVFAEPVFLEDVRAGIGWRDKLAAAVTAYLPASLRDTVLGVSKHRVDDLSTIVFSSGSTGDPKGIMLSHRNIRSNIDGIRSRARFGPEDRVVGVLPFFHSFGLTGTLWAPLLLEVGAVYHPDPRDSRGVGKLAQQYRATVLMATPTFLRMYCRRCEPEQLASIDWVLAAGEKLPRDVADDFQRRFGIEPWEGYGCTELAPVVSLNVPASRVLEAGAVHSKAGTVGQPLPGIEVRVVHPQTHEPLPVGEAGVLLVRGPNVMMGYLDKPELTASVLHDGWYVTGDIARIDEQGYIEITDRLSRFSKIGGEMVPHLKVEEALAQLTPPSENPTFVVTGVPDPRKGERLVVLHTGLPHSPEQIVRRLQEQGLANLWIPQANSFFQVDEIPILGSGKVDLKRAKETAKACLAASDEPKERSD